MDAGAPLPSPAIVNAVGEPDRVVHLSHPELVSAGSLQGLAVRSERQLAVYGDAFQTVLNGFTRGVERVDVFRAGPLSMAFEVGRRVTKTFHPPVTVWNYHQRRYDWGVELNPQSELSTSASARAVLPPLTL